MPIPVLKYRCGFKCGRRADGSKKAVQQHEQKCLNNPETRSCMTCKNQLYERDSDDYGVKYYRGCKLNLMNDFIDEMYKCLETDTRHIKPLVHCPNWNAEEEHYGTEAFLNEIRPKLEKAYKERKEASAFPF